MSLLTFFLLLLTLIFFSFAYFFGRELLKKFVFITRFAQSTTQEITWEVSGQKSSGMRTIVLRGQRPFSVLVGVELRFSGISQAVFDPYGYVQSDAEGVAAFSTYVGKNNFRLKFLVNNAEMRDAIQVSSTEEDQKLTPSEAYPPHWYQRLGLF